jgi:hypothetical protein
MTAKTIKFKCGNNVQDYTIIGLHSKRLIDEKLGAIEWATPHSYLEELSEVVAILQRVHHDIMNIRQYSLYVVVWALRVRHSDKMNSYLLKKDRTLQKMIREKNEMTMKKTQEFRERSNWLRATDLTSTIDWKDAVREFYSNMDGIPIRWGYMPLLNDSDSNSVCASILISNVANSFLIALDNEIPETVMTDDVLHSIVNPEVECDYHHFNYIYENLSSKIYHNDRIVMSFGRPDDITVCIDGICSSSIVDAFRELTSHNGNNDPCDD